MKPRTTGLLLLIAAALGAFVYFYEFRDDGEGGRSGEVEKRLFSGFSADQVERIALVTSDGVAAAAERRDDGWRLVAPLDFAADEITFDGMASALAQLVSEAEVPMPQPLEVYGLADDSAIVRFWADGEEYGVRLGRETPVGSNSYVAELGSEAVQMVPTWRVNSLRRDLAGLRDARVLRFDRASVDRIALRWQGGGVVLERDLAGAAAREDEGDVTGDGDSAEGQGDRDGDEDGVADPPWTIVEPLRAHPDATAIDTVLSDLSFLRAEGFVDEALPDAELGLDDPAFVAELRIYSEQGQGETQRLLLSSLESDGLRVARGAAGALFRVPSERLDDFPTDLFAYRFKELSRFDPSEAYQVELRFPRATGDGGEGASEPERVLLERGGEGGEDEPGWSASRGSLREGVAPRLVAELARLEAIDIVAESLGAEELAALELEPAQVELRVFGAKREGGEPRELALVRLGKADPEQGILARSAGQEAVYRIAYELAEQIPLGLEAFEARFLEGESGGDEANGHKKLD